jgi:glycosyltransferase involved in cell wall biosynthesis
MRVLLVGPMLGSNPGWVTSQGEILGEHLERSGYEVVLTSRHPGRPRRLLDTTATTVARRRWADVAVVMVFSGPGFALADLNALAARAAGIPVVLHLHGGNLPEFTARHPRWARRVLGGGACVVAPSTYLARGLEPFAEIDVIPNIVELDAYPFRRRERATPQVLWMRTFHPIYQPELALDAFARLRELHPTATLTMAGQDKGGLDQAVAHAAALGLGDAVRFPGFLDAAAKAREFEAHDLYLNTTRIDNTPVSVIEAGAYGTPIVAVDTGGLGDLLEHERSALLVPDGDPAALAAAMAAIIDDPDRCRRLSEGGRAVAERSAWDHVGPRWQAVLDEVVADRSARRGGRRRLRSGGRSAPG